VPGMCDNKLTGEDKYPGMIYAEMLTKTSIPYYLQEFRCCR